MDPGKELSAADRFNIWRGDGWPVTPEEKDQLIADYEATLAKANQKIEQMIRIAQRGP
jgi:hypothetical protein